MMPMLFDQSRLRWTLIGALLLLVLTGLTVFRQGVSGATAFEVNSTGDTDDINPGNGVCDAGYSTCTLRAAVQEANAQAGADTITFSRSIALPETVTLTSQIRISDDVTIDGPSWGVLTLDAHHNSRHLFVSKKTNHPLQTVNISNLTFVNGNGYGADGGSILVYEESSRTASVALSNTTFLNNTASNGGAISFQSWGILTITNSTLSHNSARGTGVGGAIDNCTLYVANQITIANSTLSSNSAYHGGALCYDGYAVIENSTVVDNHAAEGGGIYRQPHYCDKVTNIGNTVLAGNLATSGPQYSDCYAANACSLFSSEGYNLTGIGTSTGCPFTHTTDLVVPANQVFTQVIDRTLADNGGPTPTHSLLPNSPAIDKIPVGSNGCGTTITVDQRGATRPTGSGCDIGAYEVAPLIAVNKTVGLDSRTCATSSNLEVGSGTIVYYCVTIANTGDFRLTSHSIRDPLLGISRTMQITLASGATTSLTNTQLPGLGPKVVNDDQSNTVYVTSTDPTFVGPMFATGSDTTFIRVVDMDTDWSQVLISPRVATRTFTATVTGTSATVYDVHFQVTEGTQFSPEPKVITGSGQVTFTYTSIAPETLQPLDCVEYDQIELWVDLNHNTLPDSNFEPYSHRQLCTAITLASFTTELGGPGVVRLDWQTAVEIDSAGFNLHRATALDGPYTRINPLLIAAIGVGGGASYSYVDAPPQPGTYFYKLEEVDVNGVSTFHGPVSVDLLTSWTRTYLPAILK